MEILAVNFESSAGFEVKKIKHLEYEVRNKEGCSFYVDISKRFCSCFEFQLLEIPCQHAIAAAIVAKVKVDSLVAEEYIKNAMVAAYTGSVALAFPGRPRKKCFLSRGEVRVNEDTKKTYCM
ncbi:hypothetical protein YC2023_116120 [Brassica napus]